MQFINRVLRRFGYKLIYTGKATPGERLRVANSFVVSSRSGQVDEERYARVQSEGNRQKLDRVWVNATNIERIARYVNAELKREPRFGLCHGTRRGVEQAEFIKHLQCQVVGTEISDTASQFSNTIKWDFHYVKREWEGATDFIYSNSLDHSHSPRECLQAWVSCLRDDGLLFLEKGSDSDAQMASELDPFGADLDQFVFHIAMWGAGKYYIYDIFESPAANPAFKYQFVFVIKRLPRDSRRRDSSSQTVAK